MPLVMTAIDALNHQLTHLPGFSPITNAEYEAYLSSSDVFSLSFTKEKEKGYLYGLALAKARQSVFNSLPLDQRISMFQDKCSAIGLTDVLNHAIQADIVNECTHVQDIGMGHSVYAFTCGEHAWVIKHTDSEFPSFYADILKELEWPFLPTTSLKVSNTIWTLMPFKMGQTLSEVCQTSSSLDIQLLRQLAAHACLGDCLGRGDRHFENYLVSDNMLYPLDISYLFWPNNDAYVSLYIEGGQSESCVCEVFSNIASVFWDTYSETYYTLQKKCDDILKYILMSFSSKKASDFGDYFLDNINYKHFLAYRRKECEQSLKVYAAHVDHKLRLEEAVKENAQCLDQDPLLNMYYQANKDRLTAFFQLEAFDRGYLLDLF